MIPTRRPFAFGRSNTDIARGSLAFRSLMRFADDNLDWTDLHSLAMLWQRCGSPEGKSPTDWLADDERSSDPDEVIEYRADGVYGSWESAAWYAHWLDPENFTLSDVVYLLY